MPDTDPTRPGQKPRDPPQPCVTEAMTPQIAEKESFVIRSEYEHEKLAGASVGDLAAMAERMAVASTDDEALAELYEETIDKAG